MFLSQDLISQQTDLAGDGSSLGVGPLGRHHLTRTGGTEPLQRWPFLTTPERSASLMVLEKVGHGVSEPQ